MQRPRDQEGAPESPKLGGVGDPITICDESGDSPPSMGDRIVDKGAEIPRVEGRTTWPTGLRAVEEKKKKAVEEQRQKEEDEEGKKKE